MNMPRGSEPLLESVKSTQRQDLIAAWRFDCISLSRAEFASLPLQTQEEYCRQVRAARPELYGETPAGMVRRWRDDSGRAHDRDYQSDHRLALREGERDIG